MGEEEYGDPALGKAFLGFFDREAEAGFVVHFCCVDEGVCGGVRVG